MRPLSDGGDAAVGGKLTGLALRSLAVIVGVSLAVSACSEDGRDPGAGGATTSVSTSASTEGLSAAFLGYMYPVDGSDWALGWRTYELPVQQRYFRLTGQCMENAGYRELGRALREAESSGFPSQGWLFPDLAELREHGFEWDQTDPALDVAFTAFDPSATADALESGVSVYLDLLAKNPELGIPATGQAAVQLNKELWSCEVEASQQTIGADSPEGVSQSWFVSLSRMETDDPDVSAAVTEAVACARQIDPAFSSVSSLVEWLATLDGVTASMTNLDEAQAARRTWGQAYAGCVEPLVDVRREKRLALREKLVNDQLPQLLAQQSELAARLSEMTGSNQ
jgi:hypothetical protein